MTSDELFSMVGLGETFTVQFIKEKMPHRDSIAKEIVAMSNSSGGMILFGIEDVTNRIVGLSSTEIEEYDQIVSQSADSILPEVRIRTEVVDCGDALCSKNILVVHIPEGKDKPYKTDKGEIYVKQGANKRKVFDNGETCLPMKWKSTGRPSMTWTRRRFPLMLSRSSGCLSMAKASHTNRRYGPNG